jgi:hypothetical protein
MAEDSLAIRPLSSPAEMLLVEELQRAVWSGDETEIIRRICCWRWRMPAESSWAPLRVSDWSAWSSDLLGTDRANPERAAMARLKHCSHMLAVDPRACNRGSATGSFRTAPGDREARGAPGDLDLRSALSLNAHSNIRRSGSLSHLPA